MSIDLEMLPLAAPSHIMWDVVERHLDEAEFLFERWESALRSPRYDLGELEETLERRLLAHLDGLLVGGPAVTERLLRPALLDSKELPRVVVAALALLSSGDDGVRTVLDAIHSGEADLCPSLGRALVLSNEPRIDEYLLVSFENSSDEIKKALYLEILTRRGIDPGASLRPCAESNCSRLTAAALDAIRHFSRRELSFFWEKFSRSDVPSLRMNALKAGLTFGSPRAWEICLDWANVSGSVDVELLLLIAMLGRPRDHEILYKQLSSSRSAEAALWSLGFTGTAEAGDACLNFLNGKNIRAAKLAADSLGWIGGFDRNADEFRSSDIEPEEKETLPSLADDDLDADLRLDGVEDLPIPNRGAISSWWTAKRRNLMKGSRYMAGQLFSSEALLEALETAPLWRRHAIALEIGIRTGGLKQVSTDSFSGRQWQELAALDLLDPPIAENQLQLRLAEAHCNEFI
jgi:uncharacterized protein (TIGR02270 family)